MNASTDPALGRSPADDAFVLLRVQRDEFEEGEDLIFDDAMGFTGVDAGSKRESGEDGVDFGQTGGAEKALVRADGEFLKPCGGRDVMGVFRDRSSDQDRSVEVPVYAAFRSLLTCGRDLRVRRRERAGYRSPEGDLRCERGSGHYGQEGSAGLRP